MNETDLATWADEVLHKRADVPCGGCTLCCRNNIIMLFPEEGDDVASYEHDLVTLPEGTGAILKHKENGDCVYLGEKGCTIHERAPMVCRIFDCRLQYMMLSRRVRRERIRNGYLSEAIMTAGKVRLKSMSSQERRDARRHGRIGGTVQDYLSELPRRHRPAHPPG